MCSEKNVILSRCASHTKQRFDPFHIREVGTRVIYSVLLLSCHSCLYDISAVNAWIDNVCLTRRRRLQQLVLGFSLSRLVPAVQGK